MLRDHQRSDSEKVGTIELFFDLVFVFAISQLSHTLSHDLSIMGAAKTLFLFLAVWWVWMYTTWATNWLSPDSVPVRFVLFALMIGGLAMSASIPLAFSGHAFGFAIAYSGMQIGRTAFVAWAFKRGGETEKFQNFVRITLWMVFSGIFWILGAGAQGNMRWVFWLIALGAEYCGPAARFFVPIMGPSNLSSWKVSAAHMAERCGLFVIIALGEMVMMAGAKVAALPSSGPTMGGFLASVILAIAMWWIYFSHSAEDAAERFALQANVGEMARAAYTYAHIPIIMGIILMAVAIDLVLSQPEILAKNAALLIMVAAPFIYLLGQAIFLKIATGKAQNGTFFGMVAAPIFGLLAQTILEVPQWILMGGMAAILTLVATIDGVASHKAKGI